MSRRVAVLRPEPGNAATCARGAALGLEMLALPLFEVAPLDWVAPDPRDFDALLLTSANAVRMAGAGLSALAALPVFSVGAATAAAAQAARLKIAATGSDNATALIGAAARQGVARALHLGGRETTVAVAGIVRASIPVYESAPRNIANADLHALADGVALLHSPRAARRLGQLVGGADLPRLSIAIAALSEAVAAAAGDGWRTVAVAATPEDAALLAVAAEID